MKKKQKMSEEIDINEYRANSVLKSREIETQKLSEKKRYLQWFKRIFVSAKAKKEPDLSRQNFHLPLATTIVKAKELKDLAMTTTDWLKRKGASQELISKARSLSLEEWVRC